MAMGLYNGKNPVAQLGGCHDLHMSDGNPCSNETQTGIRLNRGHYIKGSHPLSKHAFLEIVNTTKVHRRTIRKCFKVYIAEGVKLKCVSLNTI